MKTIKDIFPDSLIRVIKDVENNKLIDSNMLIDILKGAKLNGKDFENFNQYDHPVSESYGRNKIFEGINFSIYIMSWSLGDFTAIHSHGLSDWGAVYFFGENNHRLYKSQGNKIELAEKGIIPKGTIAPVNGSLVHAMGNLNQKPIMTLHIYGSNHSISNANDDSLVYELEKKQIRTTNGSAYLNMKDEICKQTERGIITNVETIVDYFNIIQAFYKRNKINEIENYIDKILKNPELYFEQIKIKSTIYQSLEKIS